MLQDLIHMPQPGETWRVRDRKGAESALPCCGLSMAGRGNQCDGEIVRIIFSIPSLTHYNHIACGTCGIPLPDDWVTYRCQRHNDALWVLPYTFFEPVDDATVS